MTLTGQDRRGATEALDPPAARLTVLAWLFGAAVLLHQQQLDDWTVPSLGLLVTLAAVAVVLRPQSVRRLAVLVGLHAASAVDDLPLVVNHWLLVLLAEVVALLALALGWLRREGWVRDPGQVYLRVAPLLRVLFLLVYLVAAFAKVNSGFLDADLSCGTAMVDRLLTAGPVDLRTGVLDAPVVWGTIAIEFLLPLGLAFRRTRLMALFAGTAFHVVLALAGHVPFSGFALAFYWLFTPDDVLLRARDVLAARPRLQQAVARVGEVASGRHGTVAGVAGWLLLVGTLQVPAAAPLVERGAQLVFIVLTAVLVWALVACLSVRPGAAWRGGSLRLASAVWWLGPVLVLANAASPYVGARTQTTFTMYSNLQTEGDAWNHLLVPSSVQVLDRQDHLVGILASDHPELQRAADNDWRYVWDGLRAWAHRHPGASLVYEDRGVRHVVARAGDDDRLRISTVAAAFAYYRDVPSPEDNACRTTRPHTADQHS